MINDIISSNYKTHKKGDFMETEDYLKKIIRNQTSRNGNKRR